MTIAPSEATATAATKKLDTHTAAVSEQTHAFMKHEAMNNISSQSDNADEHGSESAEPLELDESTKRYGYAAAAAMVLITFYSVPHGASGKSAHYVWWCGWMTAVATGLGALPFYWLRDINKYWLGICNGLAGGMMLAATGCLFYEAWHIPQYADYGVSVTYRLLVGVGLGVLFIKFTKVFLEDYEDVKVCGLRGLDARKALLIMAVMTLHSISEGVRVLRCVALRMWGWLASRSRSSFLLLLHTSPDRCWRVVRWRRRHSARPHCDDDDGDPQHPRRRRNQPRAGAAWAQRLLCGALVHPLEHPPARVRSAVVPLCRAGAFRALECV